MALQCMENELLSLDQYVPINADDNDEEHLVEMGSAINTKSFEMHKMAHIQAMIAKGSVPAVQMGTGINEGSMANSMASQAMSQAQSQLQPA